jgi:hypothetical protein
MRRSAALDSKFGAGFLFKDEAANPTRSFKGQERKPIGFSIMKAAGLSPPRRPNLTFL